VEASPHTAAFLGRTIAGSARRDRWHFVPKALGAHEGEVRFFASRTSHGAFDSLRDTGRGREVRAVMVPQIKLDTLWENFGRPDVSVVKIDTEGAEVEVLRGATACLRATRPCILLEWNATNLLPFGVQPGFLLEFAAELNYDLSAAPGLIPVHTPEQLRLQMGLGETFMLTPRP
jgi:FkbM family methyltransferase